MWGDDLRSVVDHRQRGADGAPLQILGMGLFTFFGVGDFFRVVGVPLFFEFFEFGEEGVGAF